MRTVVEVTCDWCGGEQVVGDAPSLSSTTRTRGGGSALTRVVIRIELGGAE